jgi:hypothetical protein
MSRRPECSVGEFPQGRTHWSILDSYRTAEAVLFHQSLKLPKYVDPLRTTSGASMKPVTLRGWERASCLPAKVLGKGLEMGHNQGGTEGGGI